jgi:hypothetical protein
VPSTGGLLDRTGEFADRGQKRYVDTVVRCASRPAESRPVE